MIAIIDYGAGNLFSVKNALDYIGLANCITDDIKELIKADALILPGVGAFADAMGMLQKSGLIPIIKEQIQKKPTTSELLDWIQALSVSGIDINEITEHIPYIGVLLKKNQDIDTVKGYRNVY